MMQFQVDTQWEGKRLDRFLFAHCPAYPAGILFKAFRKRDIRINDKRSSAQTLLQSGDVITAYLPEEPANTGSNQEDETHGHRSSSQTMRRLDGHVFSPVILYEDEQLLVVNKPQGIAVQRTKQPSPSKSEGKTALSGTSEEKPYDEQFRLWWASARSPLCNGFPALCHRLDRNTGGLMMLAKTEAARSAVAHALKSHQIRKFYRCFVSGRPTPPTAEVNAWLEKDARAGRVYIHEQPHARAVPILTKYRVVAGNEAVSLLEVEIITGRTHQIRAQMARLGHPILGDSRYGSNTVNRRYGVDRQLLWACALRFDKTLDGSLREIAGQAVACGIPVDALPPAIRSLFSDLFTPNEKSIP